MPVDGMPLGAVFAAELLVVGASGVESSGLLQPVRSSVPARTNPASACMVVGRRTSMPPSVCERDC